MVIVVIFFAVTMIAGFLLFVFVPHTARGNEATPAETAPTTACVPFVEMQAPRSDDPAWKQTGAEEKISVVSGTETTVVWSFIRYEHREKKGLALDAHYFFGKLGMLTWECAERGTDQATKEKRDLRVALLRCGLWSPTIFSAEPVSVTLSPDAVNPTRVTLTVRSGKKTAIAIFER